jgi:hypothetical protein
MEDIKKHRKEKKQAKRDLSIKGIRGTKIKK